MASLNFWCKWEIVEPDVLKEWEINIFKITDSRISFYSRNTNSLPPKPKSSFSLFLWIFLLCMFHFCLYYTVMSVPWTFVITCWERADLLALLCVMFPRVFVTFSYGVLGQVTSLIVSILGLCLLLYF